MGFADFGRSIVENNKRLRDHTLGKYYTSHNKKRLNTDELSDLGATDLKKATHARKMKERRIHGPIAIAFALLFLYMIFRTLF